MTVEPRGSDKVTNLCLEFHFRSSEDLIDLALVYDALARMDLYPPLFMPYFPYARQDRVCNPGEALSVKVIADLIREVNTSQKIELWDPHSDVVQALFPAGSTVIIEQHELAAPFFVGWEKAVIVAPDAGAAKKARKLADRLNLPFIQAHKTRDVKTGEITGTSVEHWQGVAENDWKFIIVDDICDGGRTFIELGQALRKLGATGELHLYVTHGIFSKGLLVFKDLFEKVYCPNVMNQFWIPAFKDGVIDIQKNCKDLHDDD